MVSVRISRPEDIGAIIRAYRRAHKLSQIALAGKLDVSQRWVSHVENGKSKLQLELVLRVFNELGIDLVASVGEEAAKTKPRRSAGSDRGRVTDIDKIVDG